MIALRLLAFVLGSGTMGLLLLAHRALPLENQQIVAMTLVSAAGIVLTRFHLRHSDLNGIEARRAEQIVWLTAFLSVLGVQLLTRSIGTTELMGQGFLLMTPLVAQAMLVSALIGPSASLFALTGTMLLLGVSRALPVDMLAATWLAGAVGAHAVNPLKRRSHLVRAMTIQIAAQAVIAVSVTAVNVSPSNSAYVFESAGWAAVAAVGATAIFWLAVAVLERIFGIVSDWSLLELCSPDHPLLAELCVRAPGTYAHSVIVGNLAESAAQAIGANPVLVRAMAYYHDVGKISKPGYFIENQVGENIHDSMSPTFSARVIAEHVKEGMVLAKKHHLPQVIRDGIEQHHGTSLISYFYNQALRQFGDATGDSSFEQHFRYEGPKPQTTECAILMLADSVEAATRLIPRGASEELEATVYRIIEDRRSDGQLDECDLTLRDLQYIHAAFMRSLNAIRHERVQYGDENLDSAPAPTQDNHTESDQEAHSLHGNPHGA